MIARFDAGRAFVGLVLACLLPASSGFVASAAGLNDGALVDRLRAGGNNIYFRHVATDWRQSDDLREAGDWRICEPSRMRQLSAAGRADAVAIGEAMRKLRVPVNQVLASPYCRTMETARLMALGPVEASTDVMNLRAADYFGGRDAIVATARRLLASAPAAGANRVIVAHGNVAREATPYYPGEGEALVFAPDGAGGFTLVGRVPAADWARLLLHYNE